MPFVSVTRLRIRKWRFLPAFALYAVRTSKQASRAAGFRGGALLPDAHWTFWTLTLWDSEADMRAYITAGAHLVVMPRLMHWCDEASIVHWDQGGSDLPSWREADARMRAEGRPSKVRRPTPEHSVMAFAPPRAGAGAPMVARPSG